MIEELIEIARPRQWYKNLVVFAALFFSGSLFLPEAEGISLLAFISLCLVSSGSYVINDILDCGNDKLHPLKSHRPIPSGRLSKKSALAWAVLLYAAGALIGISIGIEFLAVLIVLAAMMQVYNFLLEKVAFADILAISSNFALRAAAGGIAIRVAVSPWLLVAAFLLALFLAAVKRRSDIEALGKKASRFKPVFAVYSPSLLWAVIAVSGSALFVTYCLYSFIGTKAHPWFAMATVPFVFFALFRYLYLSGKNPEVASNPQMVFCDLQMDVCMLFWTAVFFAGLYMG